MRLIDLQNRFCDQLIADEGGYGWTALAGSADRGMAVYRHAYRARLIDCLRDTFEKTWSWLGDAAFEEAAAHHIRSRPPSSWTLGHYGLGFDVGLAALYPDDPEVRELAWLDWTLRRAFDGPDAEPVSREALAEVDWDEAILDLVPTLAICDLESNCVAIWRALHDGEAPPPAERLPARAGVRVWRSGFQPRYASVDDFELKMLALASQGPRFSDLCATIEGRDGDGLAAERIGMVLSSWLEDGLVCAIR